MAPVSLDRHIGRAITPECDWLACPAVAGAPAVGLSELLAPQSRLVVVAPHPDDEVLACGGLLALHADRGGRACVIGVTDGEASHAADPARSRAELAQTRRTESTRGLRSLVAAPQVTRLGLPDGQVCAHRDRLIAALLRLIEPGDTVLVTWRFDGHPDHETCGQAAARACEAIGCRLLEAPVWMWDWSSPGDRRVPWHRMLRLPLPATVQARKTQALAMHHTQLQPRGGDDEPDPVLGPGIVSRAARSFELFF